MLYSLGAFLFLRVIYLKTFHMNMRCLLLPPSFHVLRMYEHSKRRQKRKKILFLFACFSYSISHFTDIQIYMCCIHIKIGIRARYFYWCICMFINCSLSLCNRFRSVVFYLFKDVLSMSYSLFCIRNRNVCMTVICLLFFSFLSLVLLGILH